MSTGILPKGTTLPRALRTIYQQEGLRGLYSGVLPRIIWSSLFGGLGFCFFETFKSMLINNNYNDDNNNDNLLKIKKYKANTCLTCNAATAKFPSCLPVLSHSKHIT